MIIAAQVAIGEKQVGDTLNSAEQTFYLAKLNAMLDSWSTEGLLVTNLLQESFSLTTGTVSYTIGSGGTFNTTRPTKIVDPCFIRDSGNYDSPLEIISMEAYGELRVKSVGNTYPMYLAYNMANVAGLATIFLYPAPSASLTLYINSWKQLQQFAAVTDTVVLPPGYQRAIESNFGIEIAPGLTPISAELKQIAKESKAAIKSINLPFPVLRMDSGIISQMRGNILTGP